MATSSTDQPICSGTAYIVGEMSGKQRVFFDWTVDTLLYLVVLGFFSEYTSGVTIDSFSTIFFASLVLYGLTYVTFALKSRVGVRFASQPGRRIAHGLSVWAILFFSKFVFLEVLNLVFGDAVDFRSFVWLMAVLVVVVVLGIVMDLIYTSLADTVELKDRIDSASANEEA